MARLRKLALAVLAGGAAFSGSVAATLADSDGGTPPTTTVVATTPTTSTTPTTASTTTTTTTTSTSTTTTKTTTTTTDSGPSTIAVPTTNPFKGRGMWIWELPQSSGGNVAKIIARAERYKIGTVLIKSGDGTTYWNQFSKKLVGELHEAGLKVCAWQFVYGISPAAEARIGAEAVRKGADCLVIDAESSYQGRYAQATTYIAVLRKLIGKKFPVGLAGFPYVDYHLSFPYSVFLGPNGAQYNLPQMYWADIGTTVSDVFVHTYEYNEIYKRPIYPLGQLWGKLPAAAIEQFNLLAGEYGATGVSWWDWQSAKSSYFADIDKSSKAPYALRISHAAATIRRGNVGDLVIWAQEHLRGAGYAITIDGDFGPRTQAAVRAFQKKKRLTVTGTVNAATWTKLDAVAPVSVRWVKRKGKQKAVVSRGTAGGARELTVSVPAWTKRIKSRDELHGEPGAGRPSSARR